MVIVFICGPPAAGKMTIGQELQKITGYKLFYNHMSLELVHQFFDFGTAHFSNLDRKIRFSIFEEIANSTIDGLIFTMVWAFNEKEDEEYIDAIIKLFAKRNPNIYFVELVCDLEERIKRNRHAHRLKNKPSKRNIAFSESLLLKEEQLFRMNSGEGEFSDKQIFKIFNTNLSAPEAAEKIVEKFDLL